MLCEEHHLVSVLPSWYLVHLADVVKHSSPEVRQIWVQI